MKLRSNRLVEREAVNAARSFFEGQRCVFQEVDGSNDYGKDAYIDLPQEDEVSGLCAALQIKGGKSIRRATGDYAIRSTASHRKLWRTSTVPVVGVIYDPEDGLLRWVNLSTALRGSGTNGPVRVPSAQVLTPESLIADFRNSILATQRNAGAPFIGLRSSDADVRDSAAYDCFALGRGDAGYLIILRYLIKSLPPDTRTFALHLLAHTTPHPDIFWGKNTWIVEDVKAQVREHFRWSVDEILAMLAVAPVDTFDRGLVGQDVCLLLDQDPTVARRLRAAAVEAIRSGPEELAESALSVFLYWIGEQAPSAMKELLSEVPELRELGILPNVMEALEEFGYISMF